MTPVLIGKGLLLEGSNPKIEDKQVPGNYTAQLHGESLRGFFFVAHLDVFFSSFHPSLSAVIESPRSAGGVHSRGLIKPGWGVLGGAEDFLLSIWSYFRMIPIPSKLGEAAR